MNIDDLTEAYMNIKNERARIAAEFKKADNELVSDMAVLEQEMLKTCSSLNVETMRTKHGTVIRSIKNRFHVLDWDSFYQFVLDNQAPQLLTKRVHEANFNEFMLGREDQGLPPGVNIAREYTITVRKPVAETASFNPELVA